MGKSLKVMASRQHYKALNTLCECEDLRHTGKEVTMSITSSPLSKGTGLSLYLLPHGQLFLRV